MTIDIQFKEHGDDPLFRRIRQHAELRLTFNAGQSDKQRLVQIKIS